MRVNIHTEIVVVLGEDIGKYDGPYKVTKGQYKKCGERQILDTAIIEMGFGGLSVGATMDGL
jgi:pyruvate dehydrogenase E1 component beta subunit